MMLSRKRFEIAHGVRTSTEVFVVSAEAGGITGWGSGTPSSLVADSAENFVSALSDFCRHDISLEDYFDTNASSNLRKKSPSASAAVDIAMHDLKGKTEGRSLSEMLGGRPTDIEISATVDLACGESAGEEAAKLVQSGFRIIKLKIGKSVEEDIRRVFAVREGVGTDVRIITDANCAYSYDEAVAFLDETADARLEMLEQPIETDHLEQMAGLRGRSEVLICADESVVNENDLVSLVEAEAADVVNIKLMKSGGIGAAIKMKEIANEAGVETMVGSMGDIGLSIGAAAHIASSSGMIYADLDSHLNIQTVCDGPNVEQGRLRVPSGPGIGVSLLPPWHDAVRRQFAVAAPP